jgi:hypothetical protein
MAIDWTELYKTYKGQWIALAGDEITVISSAKTLREARQQAAKKGYDRPLFTQIPNKVVPFVGEIRL